MAHSSHRRYKGHCLMCGIHKDAGQAERQPWAVLRKLGKKRRVARKDLGDA